MFLIWPLRRDEKGSPLIQKNISFDHHYGRGLFVIDNCACALAEYLAQGSGRLLKFNTLESLSRQHFWACGIFTSLPYFSIVLHSAHAGSYYRDEAREIGHYLVPSYLICAYFFELVVCVLLRTQAFKRKGFKERRQVNDVMLRWYLSKIQLSKSRRAHS